MSKISIDLTYNDLKALLGGDTEAEVALRQGISKTFAKNYIKGVVDKEFCTLAIATALSEITEHVKDGNYGRTKVVLTGELKEVLVREVREAFSGLVQEQIEEMARLLNAQLQDRIAKVQANTEQTVNAQLAQIQKEEITLEVRRQVNQVVTGAFAEVTK